MSNTDQPAYTPENPPKKTTRPNIIWFFGDQHRGCATGYAGDPNLHTPNLDRMALEGTVFNNAVAGTPLCCPFRGSLLTSRYPHECIPGHERPMPQGMPTVADAFNEAGYDTAWIGKWHVDGMTEKRGRGTFHTVEPERRGGFNYWLANENNNSQFDCWLHGHNRQGEQVPHFRLDGYETDAMMDLFIQYLEEKSAEAHQDSSNNDIDPSNPAPFFAGLSVQPPHGPYTAPEQWMQRHTPGAIQWRSNVPPYEKTRNEYARKLAGYYAMIENIDWNLGRLREALMRLGLYENTIIMFFSDHGDMMGSHGKSNKTTFYHESLNIPFIIGGGMPYYESTGLVKSQTLSHPINHVDIATTSLGLAGIAPPEAMRGYNYASLIGWDHQNPSPPPTSAYAQYCEAPVQRQCVDRPWRGVVTEDGWKYACLEGQPWMMFNLNEDPYELENLAFYGKNHPKQIELQAELAQWIEKTGDSFKLPDIECRVEAHPEA